MYTVYVSHVSTCSLVHDGKVRHVSGNNVAGVNNNTENDVDARNWYGTVDLNQRQMTYI